MYAICMHLKNKMPALLTAASSSSPSASHARRPFFLIQDFMWTETLESGASSFIIYYTKKHWLSMAHEFLHIKKTLY